MSELLGNHCWNVELLKYSLIAIPVTLYCCFDRSLQGSDQLVVRRKKGVGLSKSLLRIHYPSEIDRIFTFDSVVDSNSTQVRVAYVMHLFRICS